MRNWLRLIFTRVGNSHLDGSRRSPRTPAHFDIGQRVIVSAAAGYPSDTYATVRTPPDELLEQAHGWTGHFQEFQVGLGMARMYWVEFDQPQQGDTVDDYFAGAMVPDELLSPVI